MAGAGTYVVAATGSKKDPLIQALEAGVGLSFPPLTFSDIVTDWEMIWYLKE
jgi:hypothetical protein